MSLIIPMYMIVLVDIDHTLSDAAWRDDMLHNRDFDAYHLAGKDDAPIQEMVELVNALADSGAKIIGCTARPEKWRTQTMQWMIKWNVQMDEILMREYNTFQPASETKVGLLKARFGEDLEKIPTGSAVLFIDDNDKVIEAVRALGITALQCFAAKRNK